jgi:hypothetical protein
MLCLILIQQMKGLRRNDDTMKNKSWYSKKIITLQPGSSADLQTHHAFLSDVFYRLLSILLQASGDY